MTSNREWSCLPGNYDVLHYMRLFPSSNEFGIPDVLPNTQSKPPALLTPYKDTPDDPAKDVWLHFFLDDYRFETIWNRLEKSLLKLKRYGKALSPDFSVWPDMPRAMAVWQVYRNRWCGRFWQSYGIEVIPTLSWGKPDSFDFAFAGVPKGNPVAIATLGVQDWHEWIGFARGYEYMLSLIEPRFVVCFGKLPKELYGKTEVHDYATFWQRKNAEEKDQSKKRETNARNLRKKGKE